MQQTATSWHLPMWCDVLAGAVGCCRASGTVSGHSAGRELTNAEKAAELGLIAFRWALAPNPAPGPGPSPSPKQDQGVPIGGSLTPNPPSPPPPDVLMFTRALRKRRQWHYRSARSVCDDLPAWTSGRAAPPAAGQSSASPPKLQSPAPNHSNNLVFIDHQKSHIRWAPGHGR